MSRRVGAVVCLVLASLAGSAEAAGRFEHPGDAKLDSALLGRAHAARTQASQRTSRVIVRTMDGGPAAPLVAAAGGIAGRYFRWLGGQVAIVPDSSLDWLADHPAIAALSLDRAVRDTMDRTARSIGARWVTDHLGVDGYGIGVATIDSGVNAWHPDLEGRILHFADFVNAQPDAYDDYGHGTHVAGIIAGSGDAAHGARRGVAPGAHLVVLKALDAGGVGFTSNVIAAIDYAIAHRLAYNIRILNLSVAAGVYESYTRDPLALAARRAVDAGIVVVAAAGNHGRSATGQAEYGGIASPGNAPWVLTVGASNEMGTASRADDVVAGFSSRGPSAIDRAAKPDVVAPGVGIESTTDPTSALFASNARSRAGAAGSAGEPYMSLTGTSMAAPVVTGTVALMLHANPALTPNAVKAILQYTAEAHDGVDHLTQGSGFVNARGAVELARMFASGRSGREAMLAPTDPVPWSRHVIWGNERIGVRTLDPSAKAWERGVTWGDKRTPLASEIGCLDGCGGADSPACAPGAPDCDVVVGLDGSGLRE
jgi:serine protease AprX